MAQPLHRLRDVDGEVEAASGEVGLQLGAFDADAAQHGFGRDLRQSCKQRRQQHGLHLVGHRQTHAAQLAGRIEAALGAQDRLQTRQRLRKPRRQLLGAWRRHQPPALAAEQRVVELPAQARQRMAHRRLAEVQGRGGAAEVALAVDQVEDPQQVQVDAGKAAPPAGLIIRFLHIAPFRKISS